VLDLYLDAVTTQRSTAARCSGRIRWFRKREKLGIERVTARKREPLVVRQGGRWKDSRPRLIGAMSGRAAGEEGNQL
jgi:hypothetical protein